MKQLENGILVDKIICKDGFVLIKKNYGITVACVKTQTASKLVERGWGTDINSINKTWVLKGVTQCSETWQNDSAVNKYYSDYLRTHTFNETVGMSGWVGLQTYYIERYYQELGVPIFDTKVRSPDQSVITCAACYCGSGYAWSLLVSNSDVPMLLKNGFKISNQTK